MRLFDASQLKIIFVIALISTILGTYEINLNINDKIEIEKSQLVDATRNLIKAQSYAVEQSYLTKNISSLEDTLNVLSESPYFQKATFLDKNENALARKTLAEQAKYGTFKTEGFVSREELGDSRYLGRILYEGKYDFIYDRNNALFWEELQLHLLMTLILCIVLYFLYDFFVKKPLRSIESVLDKSRRVSKTTAIPYADCSGEIGRLAHTIDLFKTKTLHALQIEQKNRDKFESLYTHGKSFLFKNNQDLRAPLHGINGYADILLLEPLTPEQLQHVENIKRLSTHVERIANTGIDFIENNLNKVALNIKEENIKHLVENAVNSVLPSIYENKNHLHVDISEKLPAAIFLDALRFEEIIFKVLNNANLVTHHGNIYIKITEEKRHLDKVWVHVSISDTGSGLTEEEINQYLHNEVRSEDENGFEDPKAMNISVVHKLVHLMNSTLMIKSKKNSGSTLSFVLSCDYKKGKTIGETASFLSLKEEKEVVLPLREEQKDCLPILIVDDDIVHRELLKKVIENLGYSAITAKNGLEAIKEIQKTDFCMIFMDLMMPNQDGIETTSQIRLLDSHKSRTPIIAVSANCRESIEMRCLDIGMDDFVTKPFHIQDVQEKLSRYAQSKPTA